MGKGITKWEWINLFVCVCVCRPICFTARCPQAPTVSDTKACSAPHFNNQFLCSAELLSGCIMDEIYFTALHFTIFIPYRSLGKHDTQTISRRINEYSTVAKWTDRWRLRQSIIHHTYYSWWYLVFFTAPVTGSVFDLDMNFFYNKYREKRQNCNHFFNAKIVLKKMQILFWVCLSYALKRARTIILQKFLKRCSRPTMKRGLSK